MGFWAVKTLLSAVELSCPGPRQRRDDRPQIADDARLNGGAIPDFTDASSPSSLIRPRGATGALRLSQPPATAVSRQASPGLQSAGFRESNREAVTGSGGDLTGGPADRKAPETRSSTTAKPMFDEPYRLTDK